MDSTSTQLAAPFDPQWPVAPCLASTDSFSRQLASLLQSNEQPSEEDFITASTARKIAFDNLRKIDSYMQSLNAMREGIIRDKEGYDAILSPIRRLSSDILGEIFLLCMPTDDEPVLSFGTAAPWNVANVCRAWYHAAVAFSPLWIKHDFHFPSYGISVRHSLRRLAVAMNLSAGRGLHGRINIETEKHFRQADPLFSPLLSAAPRLKKLSIKAPVLLESYEFMRFVFLLHNLESLDIRVESRPHFHYYNAPRSAPDFLKVIFPQGVLSSLAIDVERFWSSPDIKLSWDSIQHLVLRASETSQLNLRYIDQYAANVAAILKRVSQIQTLTVDIKRLSEGTTYVTTAVSELLTLPSLRDLNWRFSVPNSNATHLALLGAEIKPLIMPRLKNLSIDLCSINSVQRTLFALGRSQCALTKLSLTFSLGVTWDAFGGDSILDLLRHEACRSLESLFILGVAHCSQAAAYAVVAGLAKSASDDGPSIISWLTSPSPSPTATPQFEPCLLPHLRTISIDISKCPHVPARIDFLHLLTAERMEGIFVKMAVSRYATKCLERATIIVPQWLELKSTHLADLQALKRDGFEFYRRQE